MPSALAAAHSAPLSLSPFMVMVTPACGTQEPLALVCSFLVRTARELAARTGQQGENSSSLICWLVARTVLGTWNMTTNTLLSLVPRRRQTRTQAEMRQWIKFCE